MFCDMTLWGFDFAKRTVSKEYTCQHIVALDITTAFVCKLYSPDQVLFCKCENN